MINDARATQPSKFNYATIDGQYGSISVANTNAQTKRSKYIDMRYHHVQESILFLKDVDYFGKM